MSTTLHSPPSCPDLDLSDCHPTPPSPSPKQRRTRGAPWASRRPRPFVDRLIEHEDGDKTTASKQLPQAHLPNGNTGVSILQVSPQKRKSTGNECSPEEEERGGIDDLLPQLLFPEIVNEGHETAQRDTVTTSAADAFTSLNDCLHQSPGSSRGDAFEQVTSPLVIHRCSPPVTPERNPNVEVAACKKSTRQGVASTRTSFKPKCTYGSKRANRSILRTEALDMFEKLTGLTTTLRIHQAQTRSTDILEEERSQDYPSAKQGLTRQVPMTHSPVEISTPPRLRTSMLESELALNDEPIPQTRRSARLAKSYKSRQQEDASGSLTSAAEPTKMKVSGETSLSSFDGPSSSRFDAENHQDSGLPTADPPDSQVAKIKVAAKHEQYKTYVYERLLEYPHIHEDDDLRPGYKALQMGYLVPPPSHRSSDGNCQTQVTQEFESIRDLKHVILGRMSQTDFKALRSVKPESRAATNGISRAHHEAQRGDLEEIIDEEADNIRKKPLSRLSRHPVLKNCITDRATRDNDSPSGNKGPALQKPLRGKRGRQKIAQLPSGHRPLLLEYTNNKTNRSAVAERNEQKEAGQAHPAPINISPICTSQAQKQAADQADSGVDQAICPDTKTVSESPDVGSVSGIVRRTPRSTGQVADYENDSYAKTNRQKFPSYASTIIETARAPPREQDCSNLCDILMPLTPSTTRSNSSKPLNFGSTIITKPRLPVSPELFEDFDTRTGESDFSAMASALWYDTNGHDSTDQYSSHLGGLSGTSSEVVEGFEHMILAQASCSAGEMQENVSSPFKQSELSKEYDIASSTDSNCAHGCSTAVIARLSSAPLDHRKCFTEQSSHSSTPAQSTPSSIERDDDDIAARFMRAHQDSLLEGEMIPSSALPAANQPFYDDSSDYWEDFYDDTFPIPTDIEQELYENHEEYDYDYAAHTFTPMVEIPSLQSVPPSPEEDFDGAEMSLQTKLHAYGRRVIDPEGLPIRLRPRNHKRTARRIIPQHTLPPKPKT